MPDLPAHSRTAGLVFGGFSIAQALGYYCDRATRSVETCRVFALIEPQPMPIRVFISHSADDEDLAQALISLLEAAFHFEEREVRCTSLPGYKLRTGSHTSTQLKQELKEAEVVICILTPVSTDSEWVRFELGEAWAMDNTWVVPLLVGLDYDELPGPLREVHALKATDSVGIYQLLDEMEERLCWNRRSGAKISVAVRNLISSAENYESEQYTESPFDNFDVADVYDLDIDGDGDGVLACIAILMANIHRIYLVDGETGRNVDSKLRSRDFKRAV